MLLLVLVTLGTAGCASTTLEGDHLCPQEERYTVNVTRSVLRKIKIRNYKWCMNVPPRCSYYTDEEQYVPESVEKEEIRIVNKCCPGFEEDEKGEKCIPQCLNCIHGDCELNNKCNCHSGFWGDECDKVCQQARWGRNCEFDCSCERGDCDPVTGYCMCPPGWKGNRCEEWFENTSVRLENDETFSTSTTEQTSNRELLKSTRPGNLENLEQRMAKYAKRTKYPTLQKYYTFYITTQKSKTDGFNDVENQQPPLIYSITENSAITSQDVTTFTNVGPKDFENSEETTANNHVVSSINAEQRPAASTTQPTAEVDTVPVPVAREDGQAKQEQEFVNSEITDQVVAVTQASYGNAKAKVADDLEVSVTSTQTIFEEGWLNDESRGVSNSELSIRQNNPINNSHLIFSVGAVVGVICTVVLVLAAAILTTQTYQKRKKPTSIVAIAKSNKNDDGDGGVPSVSIYTRSVFHAPLPDPPIFENPVFTTPVEYENNPAEFGGTVETHVICSMHLCNNSSFRRDSRVGDAFYDHPPSTGSYRAASIPEPPDQNLETMSGEVKEHLYDEIPCWKHPLPIAQQTDLPPDDVLSYYANTINNRGK